MALFRSAGMAVGIMIGLLLCVIIFKFANRDKKVKTEYDERQKAVRGTGYKYGFYTVVAYEALMLCFSVGGFPSVIPVEQYVFHMLGIFIGITVVCVHSIWNSAYWGINNDRKRYMVLFAVIFVLNLLPVLGVLRSGLTYRDGMMDFPFMNLMCIVFMLILAAAAFIRSRIDNTPDEED